MSHTETHYPSMRLRWVERVAFAGLAIEERIHVLQQLWHSRVSGEGRESMWVDVEVVNGGDA